MSTDVKNVKDVKKEPGTLKDALQALLGERVEFNASLKPYTSFRVGGPAAALTQPKDASEIVAIIKLCRRHQTPFRVMGGGTNLLVPDQGYAGVVMLTTKQMQQYGLEAPDASGRRQLYSDAGVRVSRLLSLTIEQSLTGLEFAAGIPGTFGGVLWMNAGTRGGSVQQIFHSMQVITAEGELQTLTAAEVHYTYRSANLPQNMVIIGGRVWLRPGDRQEINNEVAKIKAYRQNQPLEWPNAGSVFKNPPGDHAGRLIESCGLKGWRSGGAMISDKHANFIINVDNAKATDILNIIEEVKRSVFDKHGVKLATEIEVLQ